MYFEYDCTDEKDRVFAERQAVLSFEDAGTTEEKLIKEMVVAKNTERFCRLMTQTVGQSNSLLGYDRNVQLKISSAVYGVVQKLIPNNFQSRILQLSHYAILSCHSGGRRMYDSMRYDFCWPHLAYDV